MRRRPTTSLEVHHMAGEVTRLIHTDRVAADLCAMRQLDEAVGVPGLGSWFDQVREKWVVRNRNVYHLMERDGRLICFVGLIPLHRKSYQSFLDGERYPFPDLQLDDILTPPEYSQARLNGLWVWCESFAYRDSDAACALGEFSFAHLAKSNVRGILVTTSRPRDEEQCRWWGFIERYERGTCPTGTRRLWYADEESIGSASENPLGYPVPVRTLFMAVKHRFASPPLLKLSPTQRQVARLFYLEERTEREVARTLGIKQGTVKAHLKRIREKAEPYLGSTVSRAIASWLHDRPAEVIGGPGLGSVPQGGTAE